MFRREQSNENERAVSRWDPKRSFYPYAGDPFDRLFRLAGWMDDGFTGARSFAANAPCIDIDEDENQYEVTAELPGTKPEDVHVELNQNVLTITGEKRVGFGDEEKEQKRRSRWSERSYGRFTRSFTLPSDADADRMEARFANGVLMITIPKSEESKPRTIDVKTTS